MAYTNKFPVSAAVAVLFLAVTITPLWTEAENSTNPVCEVPSPIFEDCFKNINSTIGNPSKECCEGLRKANKTEVKCLGSLRDKFPCAANGGATNKIAASMSLFALVTYLIFVH